MGLRKFFTGNKMVDASKKIQYLYYKSDETETIETEVVREQSVALTINGELLLSFMCTPIHLEHLAKGFLFNEGFISSPREIASIRVCPEKDNIDIWLSHAIQKPKSWKRTTGCTGGYTRLDPDHPEASSPNIDKINHPPLTPGTIYALSSSLLDSQAVYTKAGGVHSSAISDGKELLYVAEDIGRHNTLDKLAGFCLENQLFPSPCIIITTGRISSEMLQKANRLGADFVISRTSPSSLSIELAIQWGIALIGYARRRSFRVYSHFDKIQRAGTHSEVLSHKEISDTYPLKEIR